MLLHSVFFWNSVRFTLSLAFFLFVLYSAYYGKTYDTKYATFRFNNMRYQLLRFRVAWNHYYQSVENDKFRGA